MAPLITTCPNGCNSNLQPSGLVVPGGELNLCNQCGQLVSSCSRDFFEKSNQGWDREEGTWPSKKDFTRLLRRKKKDIYRLSEILNKDLADINILDVGCSNGSFVYIASELGLQAEGVDTSEKAVKDGISRGLKLHVGLLQDIAFADNTFDVVTLYEVIEHIPNSQELIKECARILRPNGILLIGTGNTDSWTRKIRKSRWDFFNGDIGHVNFYTPKSLGILGAKYGFSTVKVVTYSVKIFEKNEVNPILYRIAKVFAELVNVPAKLLDKGHQMEVYLKIDKPL